jgi:hypothetical protein
MDRAGICELPARKVPTTSTLFLFLYFFQFKEGLKGFLDQHTQKDIAEQERSSLPSHHTIFFILLFSNFKGNSRKFKVYTAGHVI